MNQIFAKAKEMTIDDFIIVKKLGQGAYGKVYLANHKNQQYAIKKLSKDFLLRTQKVNSVFRERDILMSASECPYLPNLYHTFADEEYLYIVLEYVACSTLQEKLKTVSHFGFSRPQV